MSTRLAPDPAAARGEHANNIDALRLVLAGLVVVCHCYKIARGSSLAAEPLARLSDGRIDLGEAAVDGFFILSGYLIAQSWERSRSLGSFARKRAARIVPGYLAAGVVAVLAAVLVGTPGGSWADAGHALRANAGRLLALQEPVVPGSWPAPPEAGVANGSAWTISYECWCYAGVATLGVLGLLRRRGLVLGLFVAAWVGGYLFILGGYPIGGGLVGRVVGAPIHWARLLPCYLAGVVLALYRDRVRWSGAGASLAALGLGAVALLPRGLALGVPTFGAYLLLYFGLAGPIRWRGAARYGDFSYGIYLYAWPIQQAAARLDPTAGPLRLLAWVAGPILLAGVLSWYGVERWFVRRRPERA